MANNTERRNDNPTPSLSVKSNAGDNSDVVLWGDPATHRLLVNIVGGAGTSAADGAAFAVGTTAGTPAMGEYTSGGTSAVTTATVDILAMTAYRALQVAAFDSAGNDATDTTNHAIRVNIVAGAGSGGTALADEAAFTAGTTQGTPAMGVYQTSPSTISNNTAAAVAIDVNRNQKIVGIGTAGSAAGGILTIQGVASMTPVQVSQATAASLNATVVGTGTFAVQAAATLNAETTKVIGVVRTSDGAGNLLTSNSTTPTAHFALDMNVTSILGTAPTTVGKLDVKGADGDVFVRQATGTNLHMVVDSGTITTVTTVSTVTAVTAITNALPAGTNLMGKVGIDQTTVGTTNGVSIAQIGANTVLTGNGTSGTGAQRVNISSDNTGIANWGHGATGSAVPAGATYKGLLAKTANPSAASDGNMVGAMSDKLGRQVVVVGNVRDNKGNQLTTITSSTSETTVVTAVASTFLDVYGCIVVNSSASATLVTFKDSTGGTNQFDIYVPAGETRGFMLPSSDAFKQTAVNNNWTATCGTSVASVVITMLYVKNI